MTTEKQIEANKKNALMSTGAVTIEGKLIVAKNAVKHGVFTKDLIISNGDGKENAEEYNELLNGLIESLVPDGQMEYLLVEKLAVDFWRLKRVLRFETGSLRKYLDFVINDYYSETTWGDEKKHKSNDELDKRIVKIQEGIEWNLAYKKVLEKGEVTFDAPTWENDSISSDILDDLYRVVKTLKYSVLIEGERTLFEDGALDFSQLKEIISRTDYTDKDISKIVIESIEEDNNHYKKEIEDLEKEKLKNISVEETSIGLNSLLKKDEEAEKVMRYERSLQKSITQNITILKKLQFSRQQVEIGFVS